MSRWDIFRWRTLAGGRWCPVGTVQRRPRRQPRPLMASSMPRRFPPSFPVTPPQACAALWYKRRRGDTELCGALASCPLSRLAATASRLLALSVTAAAVPAPPKGEPSRQLTRSLQKAKSRLPLWGRCHAFGMTERARCQRPLRMGCVEALASCPLSRLTATALPKGEPSLASPFGGRWCPVGTVQRLTEPAGESALQRRAERATAPPVGKGGAFLGCRLGRS